MTAAGTSADDAPPASPSPDARERLAVLYALRTRAVRVGDREYSIVSPADPELLLEDIREEDFRADERLPYWAEPWHSAVALGAFLAGRPRYVRGRDTLDLGCGLGIAGIAADDAGARVTFADYDAHALLAAEANFRGNRPASTATFLALDFRDAPPRRWERIVAADLVYERRTAEPLLAFLDAALAPDGTALLAEPRRAVAREFFALLSRRGFVDSVHAIPAALDGRTVDVDVHVIARATEASRPGTSAIGPVVS